MNNEENGLALSHTLPVVLVITGSLLIGGVEKLVLDTCIELSRRRSYMPIVWNVTGLQQLQSQFEAAGIKVYAAEHRNSSSAIVKNTLTLRSFIHSVKPNIIHTHQFASGIYGRMAALGLNIPIICHTHNTTYRGSAIEQWLDILLTKINTDVFIAITRGMADELVKTNPAAAPKTQIIYNAINPQRLALPRNYDRNVFRSSLGIIGPADIVIGAVGRFEPAKRFDTLIVSFARLLNSFPNAWLVIVGGGELEANLHALARELNVISRIIFTGYRDDIGQLMSAFDTLVISSQTEAFPLVALEALTCGTPVIMTDAVSASEVLRDYTIVTSREPEQIAKAISELYFDHARAKILSQRGRQYVKERFSLSAYVDRLENLYAAISSSRR